MIASTAVRYFEPVLRLGLLLGPEAKLGDTLGGLRWDLRANRWPSCAACGQPQPFLAQFCHHGDRLDLDGDGRVLFAFPCSHEPGASPWSAHYARVGLKAQIEDGALHEDGRPRAASS